MIITLVRKTSEALTAFFSSGSKSCKDTSIAQVVWKFMSGDADCSVCVLFWNESGHFPTKTSLF